MQDKPLDNRFADELESDLLARYGPLISGDSLRQALGYRSMDALRQAIARGTVPVPILRPPQRRGSYALTKDIAAWLASQRESAVAQMNPEMAAIRGRREAP